jgi:hypothetical protein
MTSTNNNNDAAATAAASNSGCFDKNEFYEENGMIRAQKKDRKSHSKNAANQMEERQKKFAEQNSLPVDFPLTYDTKTETDQTVAGKPKNTHVTKLFHNRSHLGQSAKQELLCQEYDDDLLAEEDARKEVWQAYLDKKRILIFPEDEEELSAWPELPEDEECMAAWDLNCLKKDTDKYDAEMSRTTEGDGIDRTMTLSEYDESVALWKSYGLTKDQHDANMAYENNCLKLKAYYSDPDYANYPEYGMGLEADIKKYKSDFDAKTLKDVENDNDNNWWMAEGEEGEGEGEEEEEGEEYNYAFDDEPLDIFNKWREAQYERDIEDMIQVSMTACLCARMAAKADAVKADATKADAVKAEEFYENQREEHYEYSRDDARDDARDD